MIFVRDVSLKLFSYPRLLQPLAILDGTWKSISIDFIEGLLCSGRTDVILVIVD